ncbi:MAG: hypothetical protein ACYC75_03950 [Minisyncoccota bacterium]
MYKIIASDIKDGAILEREDGSLCYSSLWPPVREEELREFREDEVEEYIEDGFVAHTPPTPVEKLEDWPAAAAAYEKRYKESHASAAA